VADIARRMPALFPKADIRSTRLMSARVCCSDAQCLRFGRFRCSLD
jgi:hypothetical protein